MFDMDRDQLIQLRQKTYTKEQLRGSVHAPDQQVHQRNDPICLQHVVPILPLRAENRNDFDAEINVLAQVLDVLTVAYQNALTDVNESRNELEFAKQHEITLVFGLNYFQDFLEILLESIVVSDRRIDLLLEVQASNLQSLFVERRVVLPGMHVLTGIVVRYRHLLQLHLQSLDLSPQRLFFLLQQLLADITRVRPKIKDAERQIFHFLDSEIVSNLLVVFIGLKVLNKEVLVGDRRNLGRGVLIIKAITNELRTTFFDLRRLLLLV